MKNNILWKIVPANIQAILIEPQKQDYWSLMRSYQYEAKEGEEAEEEDEADEGDEAEEEDEADEGEEAEEAEEAEEGEEGDEAEEAEEGEEGDEAEKNTNIRSRNKN